MDPAFHVELMRFGTPLKKLVLVFLTSKRIKQEFVNKVVLKIQFKPQMAANATLDSQKSVATVSNAQLSQPQLQLNANASLTTLKLMKAAWPVLQIPFLVTIPANATKVSQK